MESDQADQPRRVSRRRAKVWIETGLGATVALALLAFGCARLTGFPSVSPIVQVLAFYPLLAIPALVATVAALATRTWAGFTCMGLTTLAIAATSCPGTDAASGSSDAATHIRVVSSNVNAGMATRSLISKLENDPTPTDVLFIVECTLHCAQVLDEPAIVDIFPHRIVVPAPGAAGAAILSRSQLSNISQPGSGASHLAMPSADVTINDRTVALRAAHPFPPLPLALESWRGGLSELAEFTRVTTTPVIVAGDFNATPYHEEFRAILRDRLSDATPSTAGTWPADLPPLLGAPIDHILFSQPFSVSDSGTWDLVESDHRTVWADLVSD